MDNKNNEAVDGVVASEEISLEEQQAVLEKFDQESNTRNVTGFAKGFIKWYAIAMAVFHVYTSFFGLWATIRQRAMHLLFVMPLCYLMYPAKKGGARNNPSLLDWVFAALSFVCCGYIVVNYDAIFLRGGLPNQMDIIMGCLCALLVLEAVRRVVGTQLLIIAVIFLGYAYFGRYMPGILRHRGASIARMVDHMYMAPEGIGALSDISKIEKVGFKTVLAPGYSVHVIDEQVEARMREFLDVAPAHNGPYLEAVSHFRKLLPDAVLVGAFETAFHETIPLERKIYAVPYEWYEKYGFQRMGYHGASHSYVSETIELKFGSTDKMISCHLGGSCSLCAIDEGKSVDTTFGLSLQNGICHANRCGDLDVYVFPFLNNRGYSNAEILQGLEKEGGLLGISGVSNDMRELREAAASGNERAQLAINHFVNGIVKYIGAFYAELGGLDNLVFTGGIGENDDALRTAVCQQLAHLGVELADNSEVDADGTRVISAANSRVRVVVIPANEELGVARKTYQAIS